MDESMGRILKEVKNEGRPYEYNIRTEAERHEIKITNLIKRI